MRFSNLSRGGARADSPGSGPFLSPSRLQHVCVDMRNVPRGFMLLQVTVEGVVARELGPHQGALGSSVLLLPAGSLSSQMRHTGSSR